MGHDEPISAHEGLGKRINFQQEIIKEETDEDD